MDEQKLTDWFPPEVLPARPGWYQREYSVHSNRSTRLNEIPDYFDGKHWYLGYGGEGAPRFRCRTRQLCAGAALPNRR